MEEYPRSGYRQLRFQQRDAAGHRCRAHWGSASSWAPAALAFPPRAAGPVPTGAQERLGPLSACISGGAGY
jgi:hypothetical protein